jgi:flavodoxin
VKTVIIYYTFGGSTKNEAERLAVERDAPVYRVNEKRKRSFFGTFITGIPWAIKRKAPEVEQIDVNLQDYDRIIIGSPVWASYPAPAFNAIVKMLPPGKEVEIFLCSSSGDSAASADGTKELIVKQGCTVTTYRDVQTGSTPWKKKV